VHFVFVRFVVGRKKNGVLFVRNDRIRVVVICFGFRFTIKLGRGQKWVRSYVGRMGWTARLRDTGSSMAIKKPDDRSKMDFEGVKERASSLPAFGHNVEWHRPESRTKFDRNAMLTIRY
jgi:hypothetical protein